MPGNTRAHRRSAHDCHTGHPCLSRRGSQGLAGADERGLSGGPHAIVVREGEKTEDGPKLFIP
jgi:hypothetical protein